MFLHKLCQFHLRSNSLFYVTFCFFFCFFCFLVLRSSPAHQIAPEEVSSEALERKTSWNRKKHEYAARTAAEGAATEKKTIEATNKQECPWYKPATKKATSNTPQKSPEWARRTPPPRCNPWRTPRSRRTRRGCGQSGGQPTFDI